MHIIDYSEILLMLHYNSHLFFVTPEEFTTVVANEGLHC